MDYREIEKLIDSVGSSSLSYLEVETEGMRIIMKKEQFEARVEKVQEKKYIKEEIESIPEIITQNPKDTDSIVTSPIVGTVYLSSSPTEPPYVEIGSHVKKGDVLCIIEAMKLMNEIESEVNGIVTNIIVQNEQVVEYGMPLFKIKPLEGV